MLRDKKYHLSKGRSKQKFTFLFCAKKWMKPTSRLIYINKIYDITIYKKKITEKKTIKKTKKLDL